MKCVESNQSFIFLPRLLPNMALTVELPRLKHLESLLSFFYEISFNTESLRGPSVKSRKRGWPKTCVKVCKEGRVLSCN